MYPTSRGLWKAIGYTPHARQMEFHASNARFKVACSGRRFGKSRMAAAEVEPLFLQADRPTRGWIVGPEYKTGEKEFRYFWDDLIVKLKLPSLGMVHRKAYNVRTGEMYIELTNGARVDVMSAQYPDSLVGEGLDWVIISEAAKQNPHVWEKYISPALADHHGTAIFPSTPEGFNWFYDIFMDGQRHKDNEWESWRYPAWENPYVYPLGFDDPEVQRQRTGPNDPWFDQEIGADFRSIVGLIYPEWEPKVHVKPIQYNPVFDNFLGVDPAFTSPFGVLDIMVDGSDNVYVWREWYEKGQTGYRAAMELRDRPQPPGYHINCAFVDSQSPDVVEEFGRVLCPAISDGDAKDFVAGIKEVKKLLSPGTGEPPRLIVDPSCENFIKEIEGYKIKPPPRSRDPRDNIKDEPLKRDDHLMDALRYFAMHRFVIGYADHMDQSYLMESDPSDDDMSAGETIFSWNRMVV